MTVPGNARGDTSKRGELRLLKGLLLAVAASAGLGQLTIWILDYHFGAEGIRGFLGSALLASLIGVLVSAAGVGYRPKDKVFWYSLILNAFVAMQGTILFLMVYIVILNLLQGR